jgi:hypothetical protein
MKVRKAVVPKELNSSLIYSTINLNKNFEQDQNENRIQLFNQTNGLVGHVKASRSFIQSIENSPVLPVIHKEIEISDPTKPTKFLAFDSIGFLNDSVIDPFKRGYLSVPSSVVNLGALKGTFTIAGYFRWDGQEYIGEQWDGESVQVPYLNRSIIDSKKFCNISSYSSYSDPNSEAYRDWGTIFANGWNQGGLSLIFNRKLDTSTHATRIGKNELRLNINGGSQRISHFEALGKGWHYFRVMSQRQDSGAIAVELQLDQMTVGSAILAQGYTRPLDQLTLGAVEASDDQGSEFFGHKAFYHFGGEIAKFSIFAEALSDDELRSFAPTE